MTVLHLGCGRKKLDAAALFASVGLRMDTADADVIHLDGDTALEPDLCCVLGETPIPLPEASVDIVVAWHVLEHIGRQGETAGWFSFWQEAYRVLKPNGWLYGESPYYSSIWAWSDPTHSRALSEHSFVFFNQDAYRIAGSAISPYRIACDFRWLGMPGLAKGFEVIASPADPKIVNLRYALKAEKPLRPWWEDN